MFTPNIYWDADPDHSPFIISDIAIFFITKKKVD